jgi:hypothetical protein
MDAPADDLCGCRVFVFGVCLQNEVADRLLIATVIRQPAIKRKRPPDES